MFRFLGDSLVNPVIVLREMGIINLRRWIAFNFTLLQVHIAMPRNRIISMLEREGWKKPEDETSQALIPLIGEQELKNWSVLRYPAGIALEKELMTNSRLSASVATLTASPQTAEIAEVRKMGYPLVSVHYERELQTFVDAEVRPPGDGISPLRTAKLTLCPGDTINMMLHNGEV
jgi:hypothetical protein